MGPCFGGHRFIQGKEDSEAKIPGAATVYLTDYTPFDHEIRIRDKMAGNGGTGGGKPRRRSTAGDWIRVSPAAKRQFFAAEDSAISYVCIQVKENSLEGYTQDDAVV